MLRVIQYGEAVLRKKGEVVSAFGAELKTLGEDMHATMAAAEGIGLAAQQVGLALRFCVVDLGPAAGDTGMAVFDGRPVPPPVLMPLFLANPRVEFPSPVETEVMEEGCLSIQGVRGNVPRPTRIEVNYRDLDGGEHWLSCEGLLARCIQHEVDHLDGVLFVDRMGKKDFHRIRPRLRRLKRRTGDGFHAETSG